MISGPILLKLLIYEGIAFLFFLVLLVAHRIFNRLKRNLKEQRSKQLVQFYVEAVNTKDLKKLGPHPGGKRWKREVLMTLDDLNEKFSGPKWTGLRTSVTRNVLLKRARYWATSPFRKNREAAAQTFSLYAEEKDRQTILKLMGDKDFLVRRTASFAAVKQEVIEGVEKILHSILVERGYPHYIYRDALIRAPDSVFKKMLEYIDHPQYKKVVLDILSTHSWGRDVSVIKNDLTSQDQEARLLALTTLTKNPLPGASEIFEQVSSDTNPHIRIIAMKGMVNYMKDSSWSILEKALNDPDWGVRVAAGSALKKLGDKGKEILNRQKEGLALEAAKYALIFG